MMNMIEKVFSLRLQKRSELHCQNEQCCYIPVPFIKMYLFLILYKQRNYNLPIIFVQLAVSYTIAANIGDVAENIVKKTPVNILYQIQLK